MSRSRLTNYQDECLTILMEECGETIQEICKIQRFGIDEMSHHVKDMTHAQCLEQELGDLLAMVQMVMESDIGVTEVGLEVAKQKKLCKVTKWMNYKKPGPNEFHAADNAMRKALSLAQYELDNHKRIGK